MTIVAAWSGRETEYWSDGVLFSNTPSFHHSREIAPKRAMAHSAVAADNSYLAADNSYLAADNSYLAAEPESSPESPLQPFPGRPGGSSDARPATWMHRG